MSDIEWTDRTWNPIVGCTRVSPGCEHCYAERQVHRKLSKHHVGLTVLRKSGVGWTGKVRLVESALAKPLAWRKPRRIFVNSLSDLFHESLSDDDIEAVFAVMHIAAHHTFQVLTKRPERAHEFLRKTTAERCLAEFAYRVKVPTESPGGRRDRCKTMPPGWEWPLRNVWIGVTAEDQQRADERIPILLDTPAAKRFVSYEPALEAVDFHAFLKTPERDECLRILGRGAEPLPGIDWLIVGGESGHGARPFDLAWARSAVEQCRGAHVACFVKQMGRMPITTAAGAGRGGSTLVTLHNSITHRKGADPSEWPADLRVREFPS